MSKFTIGILAAIVIAAVIFEIWVAITYGSKPAGEVPFWAFWVMDN